MVGVLTYSWGREGESLEGSESEIQNVGWTIIYQVSRIIENWSDSIIETNLFYLIVINLLNIARRYILINKLLLFL